MKKLDYLKLVLTNDVVRNFHWIISAFSITKESNSSDYPYCLKTKPDGLYFSNGGNDEKLEDHVLGAPLFTFKDRVMIDSSFVPNCKNPGESSIGNLMFNAIAVLYPFGTKVEYQFNVNPKKLESLVISRLKDTPQEGEDKDNSFFYVDELEKFSLAVSFIENLAPLVSISATPKSIQSAPGIYEYKNQLLAEYGDSIRNPNVLNEYEKKLQAYDEAYLKDDPSNKRFLAGKAKNIGRKKMFLSISASNSIEETIDKHVIGPSLEQGYPLKKQDLVAGFDDLRYGSYGRAKGTVKGGVAMKYLIRATNTYTVTEDDCGSILGLSRSITTDNYKQLVGRSYLKGMDSVKIADEAAAKAWIGQVVKLRSPMYCKTRGTQICKCCAGDKLTNYADGLYNSVTEISSYILSSSLNAMHKGVVASVARMDVNAAFS